MIEVKESFPGPLGRETFCTVAAEGRGISLEIEEHRPAWTAQRHHEYAQVRLSVDAARRLRDALSVIVDAAERSAA